MAERFGLIRDINVGSAWSFPQLFFSFNNQLFFSADDGIFGRELWSSDGTLFGTTIVSDIAPSSLSSNPNFFTWYKGRIFFSATNPNCGTELFVLS
jgi:ELWxxDGT repeat protein